MPVFAFLALCQSPLSLLSRSHKEGDRIRGEATSPEIHSDAGNSETQKIHPPPAGPRPFRTPPRLRPRRALPRHPAASSQRRQRGTHCAVVRLRLRSVNWPIQARPAYIDVAGLGEGFQQLQQRPRVQIVVIVHMAEPSMGMEWGTLNLKGVPKSCLSTRLPLPAPSQSVNKQIWAGVGLTLKA